MEKNSLFDLKVWLVVGLLLPLTIRGAQTWQQVFVFSMAIWGLLILLFYPHKWLINNYLRKKKIAMYVVGTVALLSATAALMTFGLVLTTPSVRWQTAYLSAFASLFVVLAAATSVSYAYKGILLGIQFEKIKRRQVEAELKLLQSQVNPHFLFNTLNNIYAQNLVNQEEANDMILQLADLMRYQIESAKKNTVSVQDEIAFIENYLALERKRLTARIRTDFTMDMPNNLNLLIPPMLFIPFIENAYKHGISAEGDCFITIYLSIKPDAILFKIDNQMSLKKQPIKSTKTGLDNIKKRLELLFPEKHQLIITTENQIHHVQLEIKI